MIDTYLLILQRRQILFGVLLISSVVHTCLISKDLLMKSEKLKTSTKNNSEKDFEFTFYDDIDDALIEGWSRIRISLHCC